MQMSTAQPGMTTQPGMPTQSWMKWFERM